jgi:hypothetical protein
LNQARRKKMRLITFVVTAFVFGILMFPGIVMAVPGNGNGNGPNVGFGSLFLNGNVVGTVVVPANLPHGGTDPFYTVSNGASGQLGIAGIGPGEQGYTGGDWAFYDVTFNSGVQAYVLDSDEAVMQAEMAGDVAVTRIQGNDFRCPITA